MRSARLALGLLGLGVACHGPPRANGGATRASTEKPSVTWGLTVGPDLVATEHVCWRGMAPTHIRPEMPAGLRFARARDEHGRAIVLDAVGAPVTTLAGCIDVVVDLGAMASALDDETALTRVGDAIYGSFDPWLWRPDPWFVGLEGELFAEVPQAMTLSTAHRRTARGSLLVPWSTWSFMTRMALGHLEVDRFAAAGSRFEVVRLPGAAPAATTEGIRRAVSGAARAVALLDARGGLPVDEVQLLLRGGWASSEPIPFGMSMRGGGAGVTLRVSPTATDRSILGEWVMTHELAHHWLPPVDREATWLSEGFASYYQGILRSRAGLLEEAEAWDELVAGFERGRAQAGALPLRAARRPRFQQLYWGGAAILLALDVDLRRAGDSLDRIVAEVRRDPRNTDRARLDDVTGEAMLAELEAAAGRPLRPQVRQWLDRPFVDTSPLLRELGIERLGDKTKLDDAAPAAAIRRAIAGRR